MLTSPLEDMILFLSYFYTGKELPVRLSVFWVSFTLTNISGALLGYGILHMRCVLWTLPAFKSNKD